MGCMDKKQGYLFGFGSALLIIGAVVGGCWYEIYDTIYMSELKLTEKSTSYRLWEDVPIPIYMKFYFFNWTNAAEVERDGSIIPEFVEMGPYVFREYHKRVDVNWNDNYTVTYRQVRTWQYQPDMSNGSLDDEVTNINVVAATTAYVARHLPYIIRVFISKFIDKTNSTLYVTKTVNELLFEGYDDLLLDLGKQLNASFINIPFDKFGYFVDRNNSAEYDGWFNMYTGVDDISKLGILHSWNFDHYTPFFNYPCNEVQGTSGELLPPVKNHSDSIIFAPDICFSVHLEYEEEIESNGIHGMKYIGTQKTFDNGTIYPETKCQTIGDPVEMGALNISKCRFDAPLFVSFPHFYLASPFYRARVANMTPSKEKHEFQFAMNPVTGVPLTINARMQLNVMVENFPNIRLFSQFNETRFIPVLWFNQHAIINDGLASKIKLLINLPQIGFGIFFGLGMVGALLIIIGFIFTVRRGWEESDREKLVEQ